MKVKIYRSIMVLLICAALVLLVFLIWPIRNMIGLVIGCIFLMASVGLGLEYLWKQCKWNQLIK